MIDKLLKPKQDINKLKESGKMMQVEEPVIPEPPKPPMKEEVKPETEITIEDLVKYLESNFQTLLNNQSVIFDKLGGEDVFTKKQVEKIIELIKENTPKKSPGRPKTKDVEETKEE